MNNNTHDWTIIKRGVYTWNREKNKYIRTRLISYLLLELGLLIMK